MARRKKKKFFKIFYYSYVFLLLAVLVFLFIYTNALAKAYEDTQPQNYVISMIKNASSDDNSLGAYLQEKCFGADTLGDGNLRSKEFYAKILACDLQAEYDYLNSDDSLFVYSVTADSKPFITVAIERTNVKTKLIFFNITEYKLKYAFLRSAASSKTNLQFDESGTQSFTVNYPEDFTLLFDGARVEKGGESTFTLDEFESISRYTDVCPQGITAEYKLNFEPIVSIENNGGSEVEMELLGSSYYVAAQYAEDSRAEEIIKANLDPYEYYNTWALFSYDDISPSSADHGLSTVLSSCRILTGSSLYDSARQFAYSVDITFVSDHYKPASGDYEDEYVGNYVYYNENLVSADVRFTINFRLHNRTVQTKHFQSRLYFMQQGGQWYWVGQYVMGQ